MASVFISPYKITDAKIGLAKGKKRDVIAHHTRLSLCTIDAIATGTYFCGSKDSESYHPDKEEFRKFGQRWHAADRKLRAANKATAPKRRPKKIVPKEMTKEDICNVELIHTSDLEDVFTSLLEVVAANVELEKKLFEETWAVADPTAGEDVPRFKRALAKT